MIDRDRFKKAEHLFHAARSLSDEQARAALIDQQAAGDVELSALVNRMMAYESADPDASKLDLSSGIASFDDDPVSRGAGRSAHALVGQTLGRYEILEVLGEGGFGAV